MEQIESVFPLSGWGFGIEGDLRCGELALWSEVDSAESRAALVKWLLERPDIESACEVELMPLPDRRGWLAALAGRIMSLRGTHSL